LKNPERYERLGASIPRGALLSGPPGTGKTLLARAVAGEAGVPFFARSGSDFVELYVGVGAKRVRELFNAANAAGSAIVFIDEIDAVGRSRSSAGERVGHEERENTLIALLNEIDGFTTSRVVVIAATNRPDVLDSALTRPGRLELQVSVPKPDRAGRRAILKVHTANKPLADGVDLDAIARKTAGMSGADLARVANEAALCAARRDFDRLDATCFDEAVATVSMGRARTSAEVSDHDREITAWHEAGHALVALLDPEASSPVAVSIVPRGPAGGVTWMEGSDDQFLTRDRAMASLAVALAGRVGEELLLGGEFTQGAVSDLARATELATAMVNQFGMTRRGLMVRQSAPLRGADDETERVVEELLVSAHGRAREILVENRHALELLAGALLERQTLSGAEISEVIGGSAVRASKASTPRPRDHTSRAAVGLGPVVSPEPKRKTGGLVGGLVATAVSVAKERFKGRGGPPDLSNSLSG
jgi:cell division protease FtsH